jgi:hypothetical protein
LVFTLLLVYGAGLLAFAQDVTVNRSNKTVEVTVTATVETDPDVAVRSLGNTDYGRTHDAAVADSARAAFLAFQPYLLYSDCFWVPNQV